MFNKVIKGDCLDAMASIENRSIDLIYLDPPFFTEKTHRLKNRDRTREFSFDDIWGSDRGYAEFLMERIQVMKELLKDSGSIFVHCDKSGEHIVRAILDKVFGASNFRSEIIWSYKRWSNSKKGLLPSHQNIYFYSKSNSFKFNTIYSEYSETTNIDQILQRRSRDEHNKSIYDLDESGTFKHGDAKKGVPLSDVWEIPYLNPKARERVGYPTQKPLILLERIVKLATDEGDVVLDPFCGSGTTCVAAKLLNRRYIGIDKSAEAVELTKSRIDNPIKSESKLLENGRASYLNANLQSLSFLNGLDYHVVQRNKGIDAILAKHYENAPVLVRVQKDNEPLSEALNLLAKAMVTKRSKKSILVQTAQEEDLFSNAAVAEGIEIVKSPALYILDILGS